MHLLTTFTSLRVLEQTTMPTASSISSQVPHTRLSRLPTQSPFSVAQSQLLTCCGGCSPESVDAPAEQSNAGTSIKSFGEQEQRHWGTRMGASPIRATKSRVIPFVVPNQAGPITSRYPVSDSGNSVCISGTNMGGSGITGAYHTRVVGQSQPRLKKSECVVVTVPSGGTIGVIIGVGVFPGISLRDGAHRQEHLA